VITSICERQWPVARVALGETVGRFVELLGSDQGLRTRAVGGWSAAETAAHVVAVGRMYESMVRDEAIPFADVGERVPDSTVGNLNGFNELTLRRFTQRDPRALASQLQADVDSMLRHTEGADPARSVTWLGGSRVPLAGLFSHLVNEMLVHGWDVARAIGSPWTIPPKDAALFSEVFVVGILRYGIGRLLDAVERPPKRRIAVEFRSPYTSTFKLVWDGNRLAADEPGPDTDIRIRFDPATLNLMLFRRISRLRAISTGKIVVGGRRPWLLPGFLRVVRMP
jgi:uncharacterized protein (TIGR03083 family)